MVSYEFSSIALVFMFKMISLSCKLQTNRKTKIPLLHGYFILEECEIILICNGKIHALVLRHPSFKVYNFTTKRDMLLRDIFFWFPVRYEFRQMFFCSKIGGGKLFPFLKINVFGSNTEFVRG